MQAMLIHGMGRTPLSMCLLAFRLKASGIEPRFFWYNVTFECWESCIERLKVCLEKQNKNDYIIVTHSLGSVLVRAVLPKLRHQPRACFFIAPPAQACEAARKLRVRAWYRWLAGEMGQLLGDHDFMALLPIPEVPTKIYTGDAGLIGAYSPFNKEANDGILMVKETTLPSVPLQIVPSLHTFIMNNRVIADDIIAAVKANNFYFNH